MLYNLIWIMLNHYVWELFICIWIILEPIIIFPVIVIKWPLCGLAKKIILWGITIEVSQTVSWSAMLWTYIGRIIWYNIHKHDSHNRYRWEEIPFHLCFIYTTKNTLGFVCVCVSWTESTVWECVRRTVADLVQFIVRLWPKKNQQPTSQPTL